MKRGMGLIATTLVAGFVLAGCQPGPPPTSTPAVPTPTFACTPEAGGPESPCTQAQYDQMKAKDELYAEAEAVFRKMFAENIRISRAGGVDEATDVMLQTTSGFYLKDVLGQFRALRKDKQHARGDDPVVVRITRLPGQSKGGSVVALRICVDTTKWKFYNADGPVWTGVMAEDETYFRQVDGHLKMIGADGKDVDQCS